MPPTPTIVSSPTRPETLSYWRLGPQITGGRWYELFQAAPRESTTQNGFGFVLKRINPDLPAQKISLAIDRLGREAHATEQIVHPNVIRLMDAELDRSPFFLVQPWMESRSLDRILASAKRLSVSRALWSIRQIAAGIAAGHETGRVHLGLDPSHVLIGKTGIVTLLGWSQSHAVAQQAWMPNDQIQLARYTAPECFDEGYQADAASDVYSLGTLIWHVFANRIPFSGPTMEAISAAHRHHIPEDLMFVQRECPTALSRLVKEMMAKNSENRPSFSQVLSQLIAIEIEHLDDRRLFTL